jgi:hypothetical protein
LNSERKNSADSADVLPVCSSSFEGRKKEEQKKIKEKREQKGKTSALSALRHPARRLHAGPRTKQ